MKDFVFHAPTKILFGQNTIPQIGPETRALADTILLVHGRGSIKANGIYNRVTESLRQAGVKVVEHGGVRSNPLASHVRQGIELAKREQVNGVVAVGGGSVIDAAKAIRAGALVEHDVWKFFTGKKSISKVLPLTCVLTLAAAGSEMNGGMVLTNDETKQKFGTGNNLLKPEVSILDPGATFTVPADYTAYGAVDAIAHVLEAYFTTREPHTPVQDRFIEGLILAIMDSCDRVLAKLDDYDGRADLMWCATLALNGLAASGLGMIGFPMHMIEHSLSALYDVPHGAGLSVVMPAWMRHQSKQHPEKFAQFAARVFQIQDADPQEQALQGIDRLKRWFDQINSPTSLAALKVDSADIPNIAANALSLAKVWRLTDYSQETIEEILAECR